MRIDGQAIAAQLRQDISTRSAHFSARYGYPPGLATVLVGDDPASHSYVRAKRRTCAELGIESFAYELPTDTSQEALEALIQELNDTPKVHGILVQLPLPRHLDEAQALDRISIHKDADGLHPLNVGMLAMKGREPLAISCTPHGVMKMLEAIGVDPSGKQAVVIGRSNIVGIPMALLLMHANATVTIAHSRSQDLPALCRQADILVAAVGRAEMVKADWVKPGAVVIDVGINRVEDVTQKRGYRLVGDVATAEVEAVASAVSPVPGGVGPLTIAMLLYNTLHLAELAAAGSEAKP